jgi:hypothetical protein
MNKLRTIQARSDNSNFGSSMRAKAESIAVTMRFRSVNGGIGKESNFLNYFIR